MAVFRWGIVGTGNIARQFARALHDTPGADLVAIGSRSAERAANFGRLFGVSHCHGSYAQLVADPIVDVVYIATPHAFHMDNTLLALEAGKAVLCEKPFAINAPQAQRMVETAQSKSCFLMEAMWTRFLPPVLTAQQLLDRQVVGEVRLLCADLGLRLEPTPGSRIYDPSLGGGCLLDLGVYPISLAQMILGKPLTISGLARMGETGVDEDNAIALAFEGGKVASICASIRCDTPHQACIVGDLGMINLGANWWKGGVIRLRIGDEEQDINVPIEHSGYEYEASEVMRCLHERRLQSASMSWEDSINVMRTMDELRRQWGLHYPME